MTLSLKGLSGPVSARYSLLESGCVHFLNAAAYSHPTPTFNRVFLFAQGGCHITTLHQQYDLVAGSIYLLPLGMGFTTVYMAESRLYFFHLQARDELGMHLFQRTQGMLALDDAADLAREIIACYESADWTATLRWQFALMQSLARLCRSHLPALVPTSGQGQSLRHLVRLVEDQCSPSLTVQALAQQLGLSTAALSKRFLRAFGIPLSTFITETILHRAADLLSDTDLSVQQIADRLGYRDVAYFHRVFKQQTGTTPLEYRQSVRAARYPSMIDE